MHKFLKLCILRTLTNACQLKSVFIIALKRLFLFFFHQASEAAQRASNPSAVSDDSQDLNKMLGSLGIAPVPGKNFVTVVYNLYLNIEAKASNELK